MMCLKNHLIQMSNQVDLKRGKILLQITLEGIFKCFYISIGKRQSMINSLIFI